MKIEIIQDENSDGALCEEMKIDDKSVLCVFPLYECPEDASLERSMLSCSQVADYMQRAYDAGKSGEEFEITIIQGEI